MTGRRAFLGALGLTLAAPAIVQASSLMRVTSASFMDWLYVPRLVDGQHLLVPSVWAKDLLPDGNSWNRWEPMKGRTPIFADSRMAYLGPRIESHPYTCARPPADTGVFVDGEDGLAVAVSLRRARYEPAPMSPTADPDLIAFDAADRSWSGNRDDSDLPGTDRFKRG